MDKMIVVGVLIWISAAAATAQDWPACEITLPSNQEVLLTIAESELIFNVSLECQLSGLKRRWLILEPGVYAFTLNYICTDSLGNTMTDHITKTTGERNGLLEINMNLTENVLRNGGECLVYGCHQQFIGGGSNRVFYNHNVSCQYPAAIPSSIGVISPTSTTVQNSVTPSYIELSSMALQHTSRDYVSTYIAGNLPTSYSSEMPATTWYSHVTPTPFPGDGGTATVHTTNSMQGMQTAKNSLPVERGSIAIMIVVIAVVVLLVSFMHTVLLIIGLFYCHKKKIKENTRLRNLGIALYVDSEKIDPDYIPIEVNSSYISKCESMGSILEDLTPGNMVEKQIFTFPAMAAREVQVIPSILQPPLLKPQQEYQDSSNSQSSNMAGSTLDEVEVGSNECDNEEVYSNQLLDQDLCSLYSGESCSSQSVANLSIFDNEGQRNENKRHCDLDKLFPDEDSNPEMVVQNNCVILTFSSSQSYSCIGNEDVIIVGSESDNPDTISQNLSELQEESLTETNLTINPLHFDPL